jgi:hypothetical protein
MTAACLCPRTPDGLRLAAIPWQSPTRPGCPQHPPAEICRATHRRWRSNSTGHPVNTRCNTRLNPDHTCPRQDNHPTERSTT